MKFRIFLLLLTSLIYKVSWSQESFYKVIPPSPTANSLLRLSDIPVDFSSGQANLEVPLYTIKSGSLVHPIGLRFLSDGCKVDKNSSILGQDWTLSAGGVLSRLIRDEPDDLVLASRKTPNYYRNLISQIKTGQSYVTELNNELNYDMAYDIFNYHVNSGISSKFIVDKKSNKVLAKHLTSSSDSISITGTGAFDGARIVSPEGLIYVFGAAPNSGYTEYKSGTMRPSSWWLAMVISPNLQDTISFSYKKQFQTVSSVSDQLIIRDELENFVSITPSDGELYDVLNNGSTPKLLSESFSNIYETCYLSEIKFKEGVVRFNVKNENSILILESMEILDKSNSQFRKIDFNTSFFYRPDNTPSDFVKLDSIKIKSVGVKDEVYAFNYFYNKQLGLPTGNSKLRSKDWGGYYNGNSSSLIPSNPYVTTWYSGLPPGNRRPNLEYTKQGMLKQIIYPTKGSVNFIYGSNKYTQGYDFQQDINPEGIAPGLRIERIFHMDVQGDTVLSKILEYSKGQLTMDYDIRYYANQKYLHSSTIGSLKRITLSPSYRERIIYSDLMPQISHFVSPGVNYGKVREIRNNGALRIGYTDYFFSPPSFIFVIPTIGVSSYSFSGDPANASPAAFYGGSSNFYNYKMKYKPYVNYNLTKKMIFESPSPTSIKLKQVVDINYQLFNNQITYETTVNQLNFIKNSNEDLNTGYFNMISTSDMATGIYAVDSVELYSGAYKAISEKTINYSDVGVDSSISNVLYEYSNPKYLFPSSIAVDRSDGRIHLQKLKYAFDFSNITSLEPLSQGILTLSKKNIVSIPIETSSFIRKGNPLVNYLVTSEVDEYDASSLLVKRKFKDILTAPIIIPSTTTVTNGKVVLNYLEKVSEVIRYNLAFKITEFKEKDQSSTTILWGYRNQYPIAELKNCTFAEVLNVIGQPTIDVLNTDLVTDELINNTIKTLRSALTKAQVSTFIYKPLIGMTSRTDANGYTEYYGYDGFGRLVYIKDFDGNLLKTFCYNYSGQQVDCFEEIKEYSNYEIFQMFTKNNCPVGQLGSPVEYRVSAGKYKSLVSQADAQQQAQADLQANGQTFANLNGECKVPNCTRVKISYLKSFVDNNGGNLYIGYIPCNSTTQQKRTVDNFTIENDPYNSDKKYIYICVTKNSSVNFYMGYDNQVWYPETLTVNEDGVCF
ncbi:MULTISPECIES: DUF5977 domain-containing protein [unclassified Sphingobacterium]|uniref:DUF5977 domain-containing protein n=1 Tax=unclassified Sphingobacterium TaxID=2609468 RepID=UPI00104B5A4E|nr:MULTISPECIES: DUF5977 domain-containing protein [unclassified Sphingobacterium]MCS3557656.1 YD repeat-containing protein [Sphingobacterium sp. JUb21]TCQ95068.1 YD repeat-containing protein [Sphingobacterium sp. JUb20]